jgi:hypothetical protein
MLAQAIEFAGQLLHIITALVTTVPGLSAAISVLVTALAMFAAVRLVGTMTGLLMIPRLATGITAASTALKGFAAAMVATEAGMGASRISVAISNWKLLGATLTTTTGIVQILRAAMLALWASMVSNPIGWILIGLGAVATAVFAIANASKKASTDVTALATSLGRVGATTVGPQVEATIAKLRELSKQTEITRNEWGVFSRTATQTEIGKAAQAEADQVTAAANQMAEVYGRNVETIIGNLRAWGVAETTSSAEILTAMATVQKANGGVALSVEDMSNVLAGIYGKMAKDYTGVASGFAGLTSQLASGYAEVGEAALDSAEKQITSLLLVAQITTGAGSAASQELRAQLAGIAAGRKALAKQQSAAAGAYGAGPFGGAGGGEAAAKKAGAKTGAGWITSFTAAISELKAEDLVKRSATWTSVGSNIATYMAKGMTSGSKNIAKVSKYISKQFGGSIRAIQREITKYRNALTVVDPATGKRQGQKFWEDRLTEIKDFKQRAMDSLTAGANLVNYFGFIPTPGEVQGRMNDLLSKMRNFTTGLAALQEKGLSKELAAAWLEAGYDTAGNLVEGLKDATPAQIEELSKTYKTLTTEAQTTADTQATKFYGMGQKQVESIISGITSKTTAAITAINTLMNNATAAAKRKLNWTKLGEDAMGAFNTGVSSKATSVSNGVGSTFATASSKNVTSAKKAGKDLANAIIDGYEQALADRAKNTSRIIQAALKGDFKAARQLLKAGSPSRLYYELGVDVMTGYQLGIASMEKATVDSVKNVFGAVTDVPAAELAAPLITDVKPPYMGASGYGTDLPVSDPQINVRVFVGDRELTDIVRTEVDGIDSTGARALLAGRRGG